MRRVDGAKVTRLTPGDLLVCHWLVKSRDVTKGKQKSAEVIVAAAHGGEGPNTWSRTGTERSMPEGDADKMAERPERTRRAGGGTAEGTGRAHQAGTAREGNVGDGAPMLMEEVCARENLLTAYRRVVRNKGAPGIDGMTVEELMPCCRSHWSQIREELLNGTYEPKPIRRVSMPKPDGKGIRLLGIPTVLDRLIQQALLQVLTPIFDPTFSEDSYGFRPGRSAHDAVRRARNHMADGYRWVVDLDLEKFFDRVNHDVLMARVARRVKDKRVLRLIRRYLQAGGMKDGLVSPRLEGTPQGGPLSPLLSNILLDELDKELERRGHRFARYADDANVYVRSRQAGERVMASLESFLWKRLRLRINRSKSAVDRPWRRKFLGYSVTSHHQPKLKVAPESIKRLKAKLRVILRQGRGRNLVRVCEELSVVLQGWVAYFRMAHVTKSLMVLDVWVRRKLRGILWRQWKQPRTRYKELVRRGVHPDQARVAVGNGRGPWWNAGAWHMNRAVPNATLRKMGLISLVDAHRRLACPA
jgi:RNA-directed DNA polymerase